MAPIVLISPDVSAWFIAKRFRIVVDPQTCADRRSCNADDNARSHAGAVCRENGDTDTNDLYRSTENAGPAGVGGDGVRGALVVDFLNQGGSFDAVMSWYWLPVGVECPSRRNVGDEQSVAADKGRPTK